MKILQVIPNLGSGGAEHFTVELANELNRQNFQCDILSLYDVEECDNLLKLLDNNIDVSTLHKKKGFDIGIYFKLYNYIKQGNYDVVHSHVGAIPYILYSILRLKKVRFVATIHSEAKREAGRNIKKWSRVFMFRNNKCTPVTISEESNQSFKSFYKMDAPMVYNGVSEYNRKNIKTLKDNEQQIVFIHVARCHPVKNQQLLIEAFSKLVKEYPNVKLVWCGSNSSYNSLYKSLTQKFVPQIQYVGVLPNVRDYIAQADALCLSSKMEGMPMTIIEAFSVGCIPISTPVGGCINMITDGVNGFLSDDLTVDKYYRKLKDLCEMSSQKKAKIQQAARSSFHKYSIRNSAEQYIKIYSHD